MNKYLIVLNLITVILAQTKQDEQTKDAVVPANQQQQTSILLSQYTKDSIIGVVIVSTLLLLAYVLGKTGHNFMYNQVQTQLQQMRQQEDENTITDEVEIMKQIKEHQTEQPSVNELKIEVSFYKRINHKMNSAIGKLERMWNNRNQSKDTTGLQQIQESEMYNQFEFEDAI